MWHGDRVGENYAVGCAAAGVVIGDDVQRTPIVATEFVGTSISSGGNGSKEYSGLAKLMSDNPCVKFHNRQRGYVRCDVNPKRWQTDFRILAAVTKPDEPISTRASFVVENGKPGTVNA